MTTLRTDLGNILESARRLRVEPVGQITATNIQEAFEQIVGLPFFIVPTSIVPTNIAFSDSPYTVLDTDVALYVDTAGGAIIIDLQAQAARIGVQLIVKDITGHAAANPISLVANGSEKTDSFATYPINADFGGVQLNPLTGGYTVAP